MLRSCLLQVKAAPMYDEARVISTGTVEVLQRSQKASTPPCLEAGSQSSINQAPHYLQSDFQAYGRSHMVEIHRGKIQAILAIVPLPTAPTAKNI